MIRFPLLRVFLHISRAVKMWISILRHKYHNDILFFISLIKSSLNSFVDIVIIGVGFC